MKFIVTDVDGCHNGIGEMPKRDMLMHCQVYTRRGLFHSTIMALI